MTAGEQLLELDRALSAGERPAVPAAELRLATLSGTRPRALSDFRGRWLLLNLWASWCAPCSTEAPLLQLAERRLRAARAGVVLGVSLDGARRDALAHVAHFGLTFPVLRDVDARLWKALGARSLPESFLVDPAGRLEEVRRGRVDRDFVDRAVRRACGS